MNKIGADIDGTLLDYNYIPGAPPAVNWPLIRTIRQRTDTLYLVSNQGGMPFGIAGMQRKDGRFYPTPKDFVARLVHLAGALALHGIRIGGLWVCVFHPKALAEANMTAAETLTGLLQGFQALAANIYRGDLMRKPAPNMLRHAELGCYYGDSDEDAQAASGIEFVRVERFLG